MVEVRNEEGILIAKVNDALSQVLFQRGNYDKKGDLFILTEDLKYENEAPKRFKWLDPETEIKVFFWAGYTVRKIK